MLAGGQNGWSANGQRSKNMSEVVKNAKIRVEEHETRSCMLTQVAESREKNKERFSMLEETPTRNEWVKDCRDSDDCGTLEYERREAPSRLVDEMPQKYGGSNENQEGDRMEEGSSAPDARTKVSRRQFGKKPVLRRRKNWVVGVLRRGHQNSCT